MIRSSMQSQRSPLISVLVVVVVIVGIISWRYMPGSMKSGTYIKTASQILADNGAETDAEVASRLRDLAIRFQLRMGPDGVTITRPRANFIEARVRYRYPVDLIFFQTESHYDELISSEIRTPEPVREATLEAPPAPPAPAPTAPEKAPPTEQN